MRALRIAIIAFALCLVASVVGAQVCGSTYSPSNPLPITFGGIGQYAPLPTPAPGSTDFFEGDSLTAGYLSPCSGTSASPSGSCFADLVAIHDGAAEVNTGIIGTCLEYTTTSGSPCNNSSSAGSLISRYLSDESQMHAGMRVYLMIGSNDALYSYEDPQVTTTLFRADLVTVLNSFASIVGANNIVLGEIPYNAASTMARDVLNTVIDDVAIQYGYRIGATAQAFQQCLFTGDNMRCLNGDQAHPNWRGHTYLAAAMENANSVNAISEQGANEQAVNFDLLYMPLPNRSTNVGFGNQSLNYMVTPANGSPGNGDTALGAFSLRYVNTSSNDVGIGYQTAEFMTGGTGGVTAVGANAGLNYTGATNVTSSTNSTFLGFSTGPKSDSDSNETVIGTSIYGLGSNSIAIQSGTAPGFYSGTGVPTFSAPNASEYHRYDGGTGARIYDNTSGASASGTTWTARASP